MVTNARFFNIRKKERGHHASITPRNYHKNIQTTKSVKSGVRKKTTDYIYAVLKIPNTDCINQNFFHFCNIYEI